MATLYSSGVRRWVGATLVAVVMVGGAPAAEARAASRTKTVTKVITAMCGIAGQSQARKAFAITTTVPRHVRAGSTFSVDISIPYAVSPEAEYGGAYFTGGSAANPNPAFIVVSPGSSAITRTLAFTATAAPGTALTWQLGVFGQEAHIASLDIVDACVPIRAFTLNRTRIT
jgi:hypothetical protein